MPKQVVTVCPDAPGERSGKLRVGGSHSDNFNNVVAAWAVNALWLGNLDEAERERVAAAACTALVGIAPRDELEGMLAAQLVAANATAMECYRRAMLPQQTLEARRENLGHGGK